VDVIGLSILSGAHEGICRRLLEELRQRKAAIPLLVGGIIPTADHAALRELGVSAVFGPESPLSAVVETVRALASGQPLPNAVAEKAVPRIPATRLDHTAICVKDMKASVALIEDLLGQKVAHEEFVPAQKVDAAFFDFPNGASLELVAPRGNAGLEKFLEKRGDALHHLALRVKDIDGVLQRLQARGVPLIDKVARPGARGHKVAFLHPKAFGGTLLELVEAHEEPSP
jgi:methylmalonyl-CoA epimerase